MEWCFDPEDDAEDDAEGYDLGVGIVWTPDLPEEGPLVLCSEDSYGEVRRVELVAWEVLDITVPKSDEDEDLEVTVEEVFDLEPDGVGRPSIELVGSFGTGGIAEDDDLGSLKADEARDALGEEYNEERGV